MRKSAQEVDLDEVPEVAPPLMTYAQAHRLARAMFGARGGVMRAQGVCLVGTRPKKSDRRLRIEGDGPTWEAAFHRGLSRKEGMRANEAALDSFLFDGR